MKTKAQRLIEQVGSIEGTTGKGANIKGTSPEDQDALLQGVLKNKKIGVGSVTQSATGVVKCLDGNPVVDPTNMPQPGEVSAATKFIGKVATLRNESFMKPEIFKSKGLEIDTSHGTFFLPDYVIDSGRLFKGKELEGDKVAKVWDGIKDYLEVSNPKGVYSIRKVDGWFGRLSASGYMDSTDYTFGNSEKEVKDQLSDMYGDDEDD